MDAIKRFFGFGIMMSLAVFAVSCGDDTVPKPEAYLRLDYNEADYMLYNKDCAFDFAVNDKAVIEDKGNCNVIIRYPKMKASVYLTYKPVNGNLEKLLRDAQKLTYEHVIKADGIQEQPFLNPNKRLYGMFYQVGGDAATNAQFYVTDSTSHFVTGSLYFYVKPNYDSLMPAVSYVKNDMRTLMESIQWK